MVNVMRNILLIFTLLFILTACVGHEARAQKPPSSGSDNQERRVETWLIAGQSNLEQGQVAFAFARERFTKERPVALLNATWGGTRIEDWLRGGKCYGNRIEPYKGLHVDGILYWQGESDALNYTGDTWRTYGTSFKTLIHQYREMFGAVPFVFVTLQRYDRSLSATAVARPGATLDEPIEWRTCREGQLEAVSLPNVHAVRTADITNGEVHPTYAYAEIGRRAAEITLSLKKQN